jgi:MerR family transcriptional regulator, light-induced transcriptional regulator
MEGMPQPGTSQASVERDRWSSLDATGASVTRGLVAKACPLPAIDPVERSRLARTIETEIIPRLVLAHRTRTLDLAGSGATQEAAPSFDVEHFARLALVEDYAGVAACVASVLATGATLETMCNELIAPAARHLGERWAEDDIDFAQVTLGLWCLQRTLRENAAAFASRLRADAQGLQVLLIPAPGEEHTLGLAMVMEFFARAGWEVLGGAPATCAELCALAAGGWFDVVGLSVSCEARVGDVAKSIHAVRAASRNRRLAVLVGGPLLSVVPDLAAMVGADLAIADGADAPEQARNLCCKSPEIDD